MTKSGPALPVSAGGERPLVRQSMENADLKNLRVAPSGAERTLWHERQRKIDDTQVERPLWVASGPSKVYHLNGRFRGRSGLITRVNVSRDDAARVIVAT